MNKKIAIMQPYFFPYLGYFQLINAVDRFVIYDDVAFIKQGYVNRNSILLDGKAFLITLPCHISSFKLINQVEIFSNKQAKSILKTICLAYKKAPFFNDVYPIIEQTILWKNNSLSEALTFSITKILNYLGIEKEIIVSSTIKKDLTLSAEAKVIDIVKYLNGTTYINTIGGLSLYTKDNFKEQGIDLKFIKMKSEEIKYNQFKNEFIPNLSIIDVMMFNDVKTINNMLDKYEFV